jgi:hypothetical protein
MKRLAFILTVMMGCQIVFGQLKVYKTVMWGLAPIIHSKNYKLREILI